MSNWWNRQNRTASVVQKWMQSADYMPIDSSLLFDDLNNSGETHMQVQAELSQMMNYFQNMQGTLSIAQSSVVNAVNEWLGTEQIQNAQEENQNEPNQNNIQENEVLN